MILQLQPGGVEEDTDTNLFFSFIHSKTMYKWNIPTVSVWFFFKIVLLVAFSQESLFSFHLKM